MTRADLSLADLGDANMHDANLDGCKMRRANLTSIALKDR